ncbi:MAG TPA: phosphatidylglycerophosphatase A [Desulfobacteria bacterium]|nr:phosphatidylglycerophosphatase A [Desulfobacteria bacterium]
MEIERTNDYIAVHGDFNVLSSAVYNGGFVRAKTILNVTVSKGFSGNALELFDALAQEKGLERGDIVGLMTAVPMENARIVENMEVTAIITAGIATPPSQSSSTVNIILLIRRNLSQSAMANVMIVATEAKTAAFYDLDVHDETGDLFTGDATDSVVVASYGSEEGTEELFAGKATELGAEIYGIVRKGVKDALYNYNSWSMDRPILERLEERGIHLDEMVATALELYVPVAGEDEDKEELKPKVVAIIKRECADANIALLLAAALHAEEQEIRKGRAGDAGSEDAACIVADELIGIDIAEYIGGKKALFNFVYYDTRKPGILKELGVFMDDAIGGLIAGCMTKLLG